MGLLASCTFDDGSCFLTDITGLDSMDWKITKVRIIVKNTMLDDKFEQLMCLYILSCL